MSHYSFDFLAVFMNVNVLLRGLAGTFKLAGVSLALGLTLGLFIGAARMSKNKLLDWPATAFIEVFRNTPVLVQLMWFFFAFPILVKIQMTAYMAAAMTLSFNTAAFCAEIFRGGIQSIERPQWEAGRALGMRYVTLMRRVILPQAIKRMIPAFTNRGIEMTKMTSLASTIAFTELLYQGKLLSSTMYRPIEIYSLVAAIYFVILYSGTLLARGLEIRLRRAD